MQQFAPMNPVMVEAALGTFARVSGIVSGLAIIIYTARVAMTAAFAGGPSQYVSALKELLVFFVALSLFGPLFSTVVATTGQIAAQLAVPEMNRAEGAIDRLAEFVKAELPLMFIASEIGPLSITYFAQAIYSLLLGVVCAIAPVVLLYQFLSGSLGGLPVLAGTVLTLCSWPIVWNAIGLLASQLWPSFSETSLAGVCFWLGVKLLQVLSPLFTGMLIKNYSVSGAGNSMKAITLLRKIVVKK